MDERYARRLEHALHFRDLEDAEACLRNLDTVYREYCAAGDRTGMGLVRAILLKGKMRAEQLTANPRVREAKRREKREIAAWFRVWLQTPDIFFDWLELRKQTDAFRGEFLCGSNKAEEGSCGDHRAARIAHH